MAPVVSNTIVDAAFAEYSRTDDYRGAASFALDPDNVHNALRIVFEAAYRAGFWAGNPLDNFDHPSQKA